MGEAFSPLRTRAPFSFHCRRVAHSPLAYPRSSARNPQAQDVDPAIGLPGDGIGWQHGLCAAALPGHDWIAGFGLDGGEQFRGDGLVNVERAFEFASA